jgi:hypothetical protein
MWGSGWQGGGCGKNGSVDGVGMEGKGNMCRRGLDWRTIAGGQKQRSDRMVMGDSTCSLNKIEEDRRLQDANPTSEISKCPPTMSVRSLTTSSLVQCPHLGHHLHPLRYRLHHRLQQYVTPFPVSRSTNFDNAHVSLLLLPCLFCE